MPVTDERLAQLTDRLECGILNLYASGRYAEYLAAMSKFHRYSFGNALLILLQCPAATHVAGYTTWRDTFGRQVRRGERGIQILAPCQFQYLVEREKIDPVTGKVLYGRDGKPLTEKRRESATRFKIATVFDISQTEGRELPNIGVTELTGEVADFAGIYSRLAALPPLPVEQGHVPGGGKGYTSFKESRIVVKSGMSEVQTVKTLVHEIAHAKLHNPEEAEQRKSRREKEVEAESVAYVVCQHFGIDTSDYSFGYVANWSRGRELAELKASLDIIHSTAREIIDAIQPPPPKREVQRQYTASKRRKGVKL